MSGISLDTHGWLKCEGHPDERWCWDRNDAVDKGLDAQLLSPGMTINCPVVPTCDLFTIVKIKNDPFPNGAALMELHHTPDFGQSFVLPLGFWNPGEGIKSIRSVVLGYLQGQLDPRDVWSDPVIYTPCPSVRTHAMPYQKKMRENKDKAWKAVCCWNIIMEKMCTLCLEGASDPDPTFGVAGANTSTGSSFSSNFGPQGTRRNSAPAGRNVPSTRPGVTGITLPARVTMPNGQKVTVIQPSVLDAEEGIVGYEQESGRPMKVGADGSVYFA